MRGTSKSRELRQSQTDAEAKLWWRLRDRRLGGYKFRRQYPFGRHVVDFVCIERRVIVEVDGGQHVDQAKYGAERTYYLNRIGFTVLRYWDDDVLLRIEAVREDLLNRMSSAKFASPHPNPLPASGERETRGEQSPERANSRPLPASGEKGARSEQSPERASIPPLPGTGEGWGEGRDEP